MVTPQKSLSPSFCIVQLTDPHLFADRDQRLLNINTDASLQGVIQHIARHQAPDLLLVTGDITQDGSLASYQRFLELARLIDAPMVGLPGNHDNPAHLSTAWSGHLPTVYDAGGWRLILLDSTVKGSNAGHLAPDQLALLKNAATEAGDRPVLVAMHHNPIDVGSAWLDTMRIDNGGQALQLASTLPQIKVLLWGHIHQAFDATYALDTPKKAVTEDLNRQHAVRLLATPSSCVQFTPQSQQFSLDTQDPGYRVLQLYPDGTLETQVVRVAGLGLKPDVDSQGY